jgi:hypothetical protein
MDLQALIKISPTVNFSQKKPALSQKDMLVFMYN